jgi:hypothetical protein
MPAVTAMVPVPEMAAEAEASAGMAAFAAAL